VANGNADDVETASFELSGVASAKVIGSLVFSTVGGLLPLGESAIVEGRVSQMDLAGITAGDSSGLALLIEWLSVAKSAGKTLTYANIPTQLHQIARLSEVEELVAPK
jgi:phospholipid transport system transporter-binding protein